MYLSTYNPDHGELNMVPLKIENGEGIPILDVPWEVSRQGKGYKVRVRDALGGSSIARHPHQS